MREARSGFAGTGVATATMLLLVPWRSYPTDRGGGRRDARVIQFTAPRWGCGWAASRRLRNTGNLEEHPRRRLWRHLAWAKKLERRRDPGAGAEPVEIRRGLLGDPDDTHSRYVEAAVGGMIVGWLDLPNGNPAPGPKFDYKLRWFDRPAEPARDRRAGRARRDYNVMPTDLDVYAPERWVDD